jgi:hypothetical protein
MNLVPPETIQTINPLGGLIGKTAIGNGDFVLGVIKTLARNLS